jgi:hypothetical protein
MKCIDFVLAYARWLDAGKDLPLSDAARAHESACLRCSALARRMRENNAHVDKGRKSLPDPDLSGMCDRIIAAHRPTKILLPLSTAAWPAACLIVLALGLWGISLLVPGGASNALQLFLVFGAAFVLLGKLLAGRKGN